MIHKQTLEDQTIEYTVTDRMGRKIGTTDSIVTAELWEHQQQWQFRVVSTVAAAARVNQNPLSPRVHRKV